jgi:radical SAM protein with 4Fe4S-binding SPASM domain
MTNTTIMKSTADGVEDTMRFLTGLGVKNLGFNSIIRSGRGKSTEGISFKRLERIMVRLRNVAREEGVKLIWYSPTPYCEFNPVNYGLGIKQCTACSINMAVEPDGTVLPCQSYYEPLGNILKDDWQTIWDHRVCRMVREREYVPDKCGKCDLLDVCGGGCPLSHYSGEYVCLDRHSSM